MYEKIEKDISCLFAGFYPALERKIDLFPTERQIFWLSPTTDWNLRHWIVLLHFKIRLDNVEYDIKLFISVTLHIFILITLVAGADFTSYIIIYWHFHGYILFLRVLWMILG